MTKWMCAAALALGLMGTAAMAEQNAAPVPSAPLTLERVFPLYSPNIDSIDVVRKGAVRRAKLYYLRGRRGKSARIAERRDNIITSETKTAEEA